MRQVDEYGRVSFSSDDAMELLYSGIDIRSLLPVHDDTIMLYNDVCTRFDKRSALINKFDIVTEDFEEYHLKRASTWNLPEEIADLDVEEVLLEVCKTRNQQDRVRLEMTMFRERGLEPMLRMMIVIVAHFRENNVVWGIGRGSSVASYCLYLIGLHKIDSLKYDLNINEFLK